MRFEHRIRNLYNELLPYVIPDINKRGSNLKNVEVTSGYGTVHIHYVFNSVLSTKIASSLHCQVLFTIDKLLNWCDLTEFGDNKLMIHLHSLSKNTIEKVSYFELLDAAMSHYPYQYENHPKLSKYKQWKEEWRKYQGDILRRRQLELESLEKIRKTEILLRDL